MKLILIAIIAVLAYLGYQQYESRQVSALYESDSQYFVEDNAASLGQAPVPASPTAFSCDGRTHCSQMTSCEEATYFIQHCPNTEMDGNHDGVPCERQWCN
ncbi:excalibur calcium-binding domain-containing protein [Psychrobacter pygoscelis]|uniref:excalibur calcium-binding domain-containing protein n=1 Tax=Psychrobacter pygoscelis TaxID=2488563 RepID=UPI00103AC655